MNARSLAIARSVAVIGGTAALIGGVTFASFTSNPVTLSSNSIASASASLKIWDGNAYMATATGFDITGLVPGRFSESKAFYLNNNGDVPLVITAHVPSAPNFSGISNLDKVEVTLTDNHSQKTTVTNLGALTRGEVALDGILAPHAMGNSNVPGTEGNFSVKYKIDPNAVTGQVKVDNFSIVFTGTDAGPSSTPTPSPSASPSASPTASPTVSPTPSASPTASPTVSPTPSASPTASPTVSPTPSATPSASPTPSVSPTPQSPSSGNEHEHVDHR